MRWPIYFILAYFAVALQIGIGSHFTVWGARPNLVMIAVVFIAMHAPRDAALLGCFALGIMQDLTTADPSRLGLYGLAYGLFALMIGGYGTPKTFQKTTGLCEACHLEVDRCAILAAAGVGA